MTRPAQRPPATPQVESGSDGEAAATTAPTTVAATVGEPKPKPRASAEGKPAAEPRSAGTGDPGTTRRPEAAPAAEPDGKPPVTAQGTPETGTEGIPGAGTEGTPDAGTEGIPDAGTEGTPDAAGEAAAPASAAVTEADPGAAAMAKSRLPALVRTMTATAIDRPQTRTGPVGRPGKAALAGAALGGALLVSVPFLLIGGKGGHDRALPAAAETVLGGNAGEAPGDYAVTQPDASPSGERAQRAGESAKSGHDDAHAPAPARQSGPGAPGKHADTKDAPGRGGAGATGKSSGTAEKAGTAKKSGTAGKPGTAQKSGSTKKTSGNAGPGLILNFPVSLHSHLSGRCIDVPASDFGDGRKLWMWDCNNSNAQKFQFASDGTVRIQGKCLDVANADYNNGTPIQIAWCNGNDAQKFALNPAHDLVNTVVGKCVDIRDSNPGNGAWLQLWDCAGTDNQKWSV
ncbi:ricin-type beta-trefoil lectin domain protein [Streptomyces sp. NPDC096012]|uniref:ricin-type beta-trefoil lectin domain protein n=1 Tax=Streptomyces sp. NPDC096012 TaxID=3155684 RepID=UPI00336A54AB